mgnify:CR=1 FL=1
MYGAQAITTGYCFKAKFENDVEMYGAQAKQVIIYTSIPFENDV